jgi:hypothetical protein
MKHQIKAKEIVKDKFWIVEDEGVRIGTLSMAEERFMFSSANGTRFFDNEKQLKKTFGSNMEWLEQNITEINPNKEVHGFPTSTSPFNAMFDVKRKLPLFTKSEKSKSLYCAGYYIVHFEKGWVKSFCPKLITVERYETQGPFKTDIEMKQALSKANAK